MANEKRYIDPNTLKAHILWQAEKHNTDYLSVDMVVDAIDNAPTVDAVEVPCKMGGLVWGIKKYNHGQDVKQGEVHQMYFGEDMRLCICVKNVCRGEWGKNVFATKAEAEAALAKMDGERREGE